MDEQLKRRLVGAAITVALLVIFVPMLFESPEGPSGGGEVPALPEAIEERTIELPKSADDVARETESKKPEKAPRSGYQIIPLEDAPQKPAKTEQPAPAPKAEAQRAGEEATAGDEDVAEDIRESPAEEPADKPVPAAARENPPSRAKAGAEADGLAPASTPAQPKPKARLKAVKPAEAPVKKKEQAKLADTAAKKAPPAVKPEAVTPKSTSPKPIPVPESVRSVEAATPVDPVPAKPAPKIPPQDPAPKSTARPSAAQESPVPTSWTVQAGTFTAESNARALADKLRKQNLPAVVRTSRGENATVYRVTIGPEINRARADQILKQVEAAVGIRGIVLPRR